MNKLLLTCLLAVFAVPVIPAQDAPQRTKPWPKEILETASRLPVQHDGRIKPFMTQMGYLMLRVNGKRSLKVKLPGGTEEKLDPVSWALDLLFYPEQARKYECFQVQDRDLIDALKLERGDKRKRDRYSFAFISKGELELQRLFDEYIEIDEKKRTPLQQQIIGLGNNYTEVARLLSFTVFARVTYPLPDLPEIKKLFGTKKEARFSEVLEHTAPLLADYNRIGGAKGHGHGAGDIPEAAKKIETLLISMRRDANAAKFLRLYAPGDDGIKIIKRGEKDYQDPEFTWLRPLDVADLAFAREVDGKRLGALVQPLERVMDSRNDMAAFQERFTALSDLTVKRAKSAGVYWAVPMEVSYHRADYFYYAQILFVFAFLTCLFGFFRTRSKWIYRASWVLVLTPTVIWAIGITLRCIIRSRPPVSTLYETIVFITGVAVIVGLIMEGINRKRMSLFMVATLGAVGLTISGMYENLDKRDTMPTLVAVLDTNFWLSTHVTTVTMGYASGFLAAFFGTVYIVCKLFGFARGDRQFYSSLSRMAYGTICFGLLFSVVGTILGGVWANDSWGRFWGWDPKENGALIICLAQLAILHGRMGGYLREFGICVASQILAICVVFSWFHVNLLGVGLHAYGFDSRLLAAVLMSYGWFSLVFCIGCIAFYVDKARGPYVAPEKADEPAGSEVQPSGA